MTIDEQGLERKFLSLTNSQESVQTLSLWILHHKNHWKKIIQVWFKILEKDKILHRLTMFYLANDVIQHAKKKGHKYYLDGFREVLKKATALVRDEKIAPKIIRIFTIWAERAIYPEEFINELKNILNSSVNDQQGKESSNNNSALTNRIPVDFSLLNLEKKVKDVDLSEKQASILIGSLNVNKIDKIDSHILSLLKDKKAGEQCLKELTEIENSLKHAVQAIEKQMSFRTSFVDALDKCEMFYETQKGEVKIVTNAYKNFSARVMAVRTKLASNETTFPSPYPSPIVDAPSPMSDDELVFPGHDSPLPGLKSLLNVLNENSSKNNKISSLDKRLSNLMQNLPNLQQDQQSCKSDKSDKDKKSETSWTPMDCQQSQAQHPPPFNPLLSLNQQSNLVNQPINQPIMPAQVINLPPMPPSIHHPPPFIPHNVPPQIPPPIQMSKDSNYYPVRYPPPKNNILVPPQFSTMTHSPQMNMYNGSTNSPSVHQIKSVISTRNEQQESLDQSMPYDPYSVGLNESLGDSFCEPADMDLGNSDDEEMNRSSNSQRVLKVIETSDESSTYSAGNMVNNMSNSFSTGKKSLTGYNMAMSNLPPSSISSNIPQLPNLAIVKQSANLESNPLTTHSNLQTNVHHHNFQNGKPTSHHQHSNQIHGNKLYSPAKAAFHHHKDNNKQPYGSNSRSPRYNNTTNTNYNHNNHQLTGTPTAPSTYNPTSKLDYFIASQAKSTPNQQTYTPQNNANRKGMWNKGNKFQPNNHHNRNRSFNNNKNHNLSNLTSVSNVSNMNSNLAVNTNSNLNSNLANLNHYHQYQ